MCHCRVRRQLNYTHIIAQELLVLEAECALGQRVQCVQIDGGGIDARLAGQHPSTLDAGAHHGQLRLQGRQTGGLAQARDHVVSAHASSGHLVWRQTDEVHAKSALPNLCGSTSAATEDPALSTSRWNGVVRMWLR